MQYIDGGVTAAKGFRAAAAAAQIKYTGRTDMAMICSEVPCHAAGTFTQNVVKAAPVLWDRALVNSDKEIYAVVINSGIANACTGEEGFACCRQTSRKAAEALKTEAGIDMDPQSVLVASTGVIGMQLPMERILSGVEQLSAGLSDTREAAHAASRAIMTTDTKPKEAAVSFTVGGKTVTIGGMCKGSGMIHPNMCTMLAFLTTDADISDDLLKEALREDVKDTYNMISVDGDTSTNDTLLILANGAAGNPKIASYGPEYDAFCTALHMVNETLAKKMAGDGEGATALFEVHVTGADTKEHAKILAKSVVTSSLTKAAIYGHDANWGRILCALGYAGVDFDPLKVELFFESAAGKIRIAENGTGADYSEEEATRILSEPEVTALVDMHMGTQEATAWGCDLTHEYVSINADYRS